MTLGDRDWSTHEVARRAKAGGHTLSNGTVQKVLNSRSTGSVSEPTLRALADVFDVDASEVFALYYGTAPVVRTIEISASDLENRAKRRALMALLFDDIPDDCQLDTLASMVGVHARRGLSWKIHERSSARSEALVKIARLIRELLPSNAAAAIAGQTDTDTRHEKSPLSPHPPDEDLLPGRIVMLDADSLAELDVDDEDTDERERKRA